MQTRGFCFLFNVHLPIFAHISTNTDLLHVETDDGLNDVFVFLYARVDLVNEEHSSGLI